MGLPHTTKLTSCKAAAEHSMSLLLYAACPMTLHSRYALRSLTKRRMCRKETANVNLCCCGFKCNEADVVKHSHPATQSAATTAGAAPGGVTTKPASTILCFPGLHGCSSDLALVWLQSCSRALLNLQAMSLGLQYLQCINTVLMMRAPSKYTCLACERLSARSLALADKRV